MDILSRRLLSSSRRLEAHWKKKPGGAVVRLAVIGGGVHAAIMSAIAGRSGKAKDMIVFEAGSVVSNVFGTLDGMFNGNTPERAEKSANPFPGAPFEIRDFTDTEYPDSSAFRLVATAAQYSSGVPILLENPVIRIVDTLQTGENAPARYRITTAKGLEVYAEELVFATGLGDPVIPLEDEGSRMLLEAQIAQGKESIGRMEFPKVQTMEDLLRLSKLAYLTQNGQGMASAARDFIQETKGKSFAVLGSGDGGKIALEALFGLHRLGGQAGLSDIFSADISVEWLSQLATTPAGYKRTTWERYWDLALEMGRRITGGYGRASTVEELPSGKFRITDTAGKVVEVDYIIMATGYKNRALRLLEGLFGTSMVRQEDVKARRMRRARRDGKGYTYIGTNVVVRGSRRKQKIYQAGTAAGDISTRVDRSASVNDGPVSVETLGDKSVRLIQELLEIAPIERSSGSEVMRESLLPFEGPRESHVTDLADTLVARAELARLLAGTGALRHGVRLEFEVGGQGGVVLRGRGFSDRQWTVFLRSLIKAWPSLAVSRLRTAVFVFRQDP